MGTEDPNEHRCLSLDVLVRYRDGHFTPEEEERLRSCATCRANLDAAASLDADLLAVAADREELESFDPSAADALICLRLTDPVLAQIAASPEPPKDRETYRHLCECAYCRQRLLLRSAEPSGRPAITSRLMAALLDDLLEEAHRAVAAKVPWGERRTAAAPVVPLREPLRVSRTPLGQLIAAGLERLARWGMPQYALARAMDASAVLGPESLPDLAPGDAVQHVEWTVPLPGDAGVLTLHVSTTPNPEEWQLACSLSGMAGPALEDALVDVYGAGQELQQEGVPLKSLRAHPLALRTGSYEIRVAIGPTVHAIPLSLGGSSQTTEDG